MHGLKLQARSLQKHIEMMSDVSHTQRPFRAAFQLKPQATCDAFTWALEAIYYNLYSSCQIDVVGNVSHMVIMSIH